MDIDHTLQADDPEFEKRLSAIMAMDCKCPTVMVAGLPEEAVQKVLGQIGRINPCYMASRLLEGAVFHCHFGPAERLDQFSMPFQFALATKDRGFFVNIGANDGKSFNDQCWPLYLSGWHGAAFDMQRYGELCRNMPGGQVAKVNAMVDPDNPCPSLKAAIVPVDFDFLKVDIDGMDAILLENLLPHYRPRVIDIEVHPEFPPPVRFCYAGSGHRQPTDFGIYGASLQYVKDLGLRFGYGLAGYSSGRVSCLQSATLVLREVMRERDIQTLEPIEAYKKCSPGPLHLRKAGVDSLPWRTMGREPMVAEIREAMATINRKCFNGTMRYELE